LINSQLARKTGDLEGLDEIAGKGHIR